MMNSTTLTSGGLMLVGGRVCLDFCNTIVRDQKPPLDILERNGFRALIHWGRDTGILDDTQATYFYCLYETQPETTHAVFDRACQLRDVLYHIFESIAHQRPVLSKMMNALNDWLHESHAQRQIVLEGIRVSHVWRDTQHPALILYHIALSAEAVLISGEMQHIKQCPGCGWLFYDGSKNHRRTWCDMRVCGNRAKNKRFHRRRKEA